MTEGREIDLNELDADELRQLVVKFHDKLHEVIDDNSGLAVNFQSIAWGLAEIARQIKIANARPLAARKEILSLTAEKLEFLAAAAYASLGITEEDIETADTFTDIAAILEGDRDFMKGVSDAERESDPDT